MFGSASVFGEQWRLEPMSVERKTRWRKEIDWLLSVTDNIVEFVPSQQTSKDGTNMEVFIFALTCEFFYILLEFVIDTKEKEEKAILIFVRIY